jgi:hypothetical protein
LHFGELSIILVTTFIQSPKTKLMDIKKLFIGGIAGGVAYFLLGWLIYGILLMDFMNNHSGTAGNVARAVPDYMYLIIGNLAMGFLMTYIFIKANVTGMSAGIITGGILGLLTSVGYDCITYATTTTVSKTAMAADVVATTVMTAVVGGIIAILIGLLTKQRTT